MNLKGTPGSDSRVYVHSAKTDSGINFGNSDDNRICVVYLLAYNAGTHGPRNRHVAYGSPENAGWLVVKQEGRELMQPIMVLSKSKVVKKNSGDLEKSSIKEPSRTAIGNQSAGILRVSPAREANLLMGVGCQTYWVTSELKNCFILQSVYLEVCIENEPVKKHRFVEAWSVDSNGECTPNQGLDSFLISTNSYDTAGSMAILAKA